MRSGKAVPDGRSSSWEVSGTNSGKIAGKDSEEPGTLQGEERRGEEGERSTRSGRQSGSTAWKIIEARLLILCH